VPPRRQRREQQLVSADGATVDVGNARSTSGQARTANGGSKLPHSTRGACLCGADGVDHAKYVRRAQHACAPTNAKAKAEAAAHNLEGIRGDSGIIRLACLLLLLLRCLM
jgi:hypothetical protein